jgi:hypothetical protein
MGAVVALHDPFPPLRTALHSAVEPAVKAIVPTGVPPVEVTVPEKVTGLPEAEEAGFTEANVVVAAGAGTGPSYVIVNELPEIAPGDAITVPPPLVISTGLWTTELEPEWVSAMPVN